MFTIEILKAESQQQKFLLVNAIQAVALGAWTPGDKIPELLKRVQNG